MRSMAWQALICVAVLFVSTPASADPAQFSIAAEGLPAALKEFAAQAHMQLLYQFGAVATVTGNPVSGNLEKHAALELLLRNTGLEAVYSSDNAVTIRPASVVAQSTDGPGERSTAAARRGREQGSAPAQVSLPEVTVSAPGQLRHRIKEFISQVSGPVALQDEGDPVLLWRRPICPLVGGLPGKEGQLVFDRLTDTLTSVGIPMGAVGCRPNFFIIATTQPEALLKAALRRNSALLDGPGAQAYIDTPRPVRIWYNAELTTPDGEGFNTQIQGVPIFFVRPVSPRTEFWVPRQVASVIAVIDLTRVAGMDWRQVTDYVAMLGLTKVRADAAVGDAPSILRLFNAPTGDRPMTLSEWDRAFIRGMYQTDRNSRRQRLRIWEAMVHDVKP